MLGTLVHWFEQRDAKEAQPDDDIPTLAVAGAQFRELCKRLRAAALLPAFRHWAGASGVVIMKDVITMPRFSAGCEAYLHLWVNIALKTMNESVVEGMGGVWDRSSPDHGTVLLRRVSRKPWWRGTDHGRTMRRRCRL